MPIIDEGPYRTGTGASTTAASFGERAICSHCGDRAWTWTRGLGCDIGECGTCGRFEVEVDWPGED